MDLLLTVTTPGICDEKSYTSKVLVTLIVSSVGNAGNGSILLSRMSG